MALLPRRPTPLDTILADIQNGLRGGMYYAALVVALTVPEFCAALQCEGGGGGADKYMEWFTANLGHRYPNLTPDDCYSLRCSVLHQGRMGRPGMQYSRVLFTVPNAQNNVFHNNIINDALNLDVIQFCEDFIRAALLWYDATRNDEHVVANISNLVRFRPEGLAPYMVGMPLIA